MRDWGVYYGTVDAKVYPTVSVYLPNRGTPMVTVNSKDSIFWEEAGNGPFVQSHLISEEDVIKQASEFAGTIPVKKLLPYWKTASRCRRICQGEAMGNRHRLVEADLRYQKREEKDAGCL